MWTRGLSLVLAAGCASTAVAPDRKTTATSLDKDKGTLPNGPALNGTDVGGRILEVVTLGRGVTLAGGQLLEDVRLDGTRFRSDRVKDADLIGAELIGLASDGGSVRIRIDSTTPDPAFAEGDVSWYGLSYQARPGGPFAPLCPDGRSAVPVTGRWDSRKGMRGDGTRVAAPGAVTLACDGSAIAKCVRLGYRPFRTVERATPTGPVRVPLAPLHEACVRAVRADYCGNGDSLTRPGETINLYDVAGVQSDSESWAFEAEWTPQGARCVSDTRLVQVPGTAASAPPLSVRDYLQRHCPTSFRDGAHPCVADPATAAALVFTEYPAR